MFIEPGTKIISGINSPHNCIEKKYTYERIRGTLVDPYGKRIEYNMLQCNKCGALIMRGDKVREIECIYKNYDFIHVPKKKVYKPPSKSEQRNMEYLTQCAMADARGLPKPKKKGKRTEVDVPKPEYVLKGEAPPHMQWHASHPYQGGIPS